MYLEYYGLHLAPFQLSPDPRFFYPSSVHKRALAHLKYGLGQHEGFIVITGEVGAGKTTLVKHLLASLDSSRYLTANLVSTQLQADDLVRMVAGALDIARIDVDKASLLRAIEQTLVARLRGGQHCLLMVDEAQNLSVEALEELRMLSNFQFNNTPLVQSFLLGQPQLRRILGRPDLSQLRQRVIASYHLGPMSEGETANYVLHRLQLAGWKFNPSIDPGAMLQIHHHSGGIPRRINTLCTRLLLFGALEELHNIDAAAVDMVQEDLDAEFRQVVEEEPVPYWN